MVSTVCSHVNGRTGHRSDCRRSAAPMTVSEPTSSLPLNCQATGARAPHGAHATLASDTSQRHQQPNCRLPHGSVDLASRLGRNSTAAGRSAPHRNSNRPTTASPFLALRTSALEDFHGFFATRLEGFHREFTVSIRRRAAPIFSDVPVASKLALLNVARGVAVVDQPSRGAGEWTVPKRARCSAVDDLDVDFFEYPNTVCCRIFRDTTDHGSSSASIARHGAVRSRRGAAEQRQFVDDAFAQPERSSRLPCCRGSVRRWSMRHHF